MSHRVYCSLLSICVAVGGCSRTKIVPDVVIEPDARTVVDEPSVGQPFQFAPDESGALLSRSLTPLENRRLLDDANLAINPYPTPKGLTVPDAPVTAGQALLPSVPPPAVARDLKPRLVSDEAVFNPREQLSLPQSISFPVPGRVRLTSRDANQLPPLPVLATPSADRASLNDPTSEISSAAAVAAPPPQRLRPAPFVKLKAPATLERSAARLTLPPPESASPLVNAIPPAPGK